MQRGRIMPKHRATWWFNYRWSWTITRDDGPCIGYQWAGDYRWWLTGANSWVYRPSIGWQKGRTRRTWICRTCIISFTKWGQLVSPLGQYEIVSWSNRPSDVSIRVLGCILRWQSSFLRQQVPLRIGSWVVGWEQLVGSSSIRKSRTTDKPVGLYPNSIPRP